MDADTPVTIDDVLEPFPYSRLGVADATTSESGHHVVVLLLWAFADGDPWPLALTPDMADDLAISLHEKAALVRQTDAEVPPPDVDEGTGRSN